MSALFGAMLKSFALEADRVRQVIEDAGALQLPSNMTEPLPNPVSPTPFNSIDAVNVVKDPVGRSRDWQTRWSVVNATMTQQDIVDLPRWPYAVRAAVVTPASNMELRSVIPDGDIPDGDFWWYLVAKTNSPSAAKELRFVDVTTGTVLETVSLPAAMSGSTIISGKATVPERVTTINGTQTLPLATITVADTTGFPTSGSLAIDGAGTVTYTGKTGTTFTGCSGGNGTVETGATVKRTFPGPIELRLFIPSAAGGTWAQMTAVTVVKGMDPGEPFYGDCSGDRYGYGWRGGRFESPSVRYAPTIDLMALREAQADFSVAPVDMTYDQRQAYLLARWRAHGQPYGSVFKDLIAELIELEDPSFTVEDIRVIEGYSARTLQVIIAYSPDGVLANRIVKLIKDIKPGGLNMTAPDAIVFGGFIAGVNQAGDSA